MCWTGRGSATSERLGRKLPQRFHPGSDGKFLGRINQASTQALTTIDPLQLEAAVEALPVKQKIVLFGNGGAGLPGRFHQFKAVETGTECHQLPGLKLAFRPRPQSLKEGDVP